MRLSRFIKGAVVVSMATALAAVPVGSAFATQAAAVLTANPNSVTDSTSNNFQVTFTAGSGGGVKCVIYTLTDFTNLANPAVVSPVTGWSVALGPNANQVTISGTPAIGNGTSATITVDADAPATDTTHTWTGDSYTESNCTNHVQSASDDVTTVPASSGGGGTPGRFRPDALIKRARAKHYMGEGVFSGTGFHQTTSATGHHGQSFTDFVRVENDGDHVDNLIVTGEGHRPGFSVKYFHGTTNITRLVVARAWVLHNMAPGAESKFRVVVTILQRARAGLTRSWLIEARSNSDPTKRDVVKMKVSVAR